MTRLFLALVAVVSALAVVPYTVKAQKETPKNGAQPQPNQVYVKIILPTDPATRGKDRPVVESWIAEQIKNRGQSKFTAATAWVPLDDAWMPFNDEKKRWKYTDVWDGRLAGTEWACPVAAKIIERADGRIKIILGGGWAPALARGDISLKDEPGSREIAAVERAKMEQGTPYVAVLIGPPTGKTVASTDDKK